MNSRLIWNVENNITVVFFVLLFFWTAPLTDKPPKILYPSEDKMSTMEMTIGKTSFMLYTFPHTHGLASSEVIQASLTDCCRRQFPAGGWVWKHTHLLTLSHAVSYHHMQWATITCSELPSHAVSYIPSEVSGLGVEWLLMWPPLNGLWRQRDFFFSFSEFSLVRVSFRSDSA